MKMKTFENNYKLKIAATPIGNIDEVTTRMLIALDEVDVVLCEDTRVTKKLFKMLEVDNQPQFIKYDKFNENQMNAKVIDLIKNQCMNVMLVSDAGYPLISDPGFPLINACYENGISIEVLNGPSSVLHSLIVSGFSLINFSFIGFCGPTKQKRIQTLQLYKNLSTTLVIFEAVHRIHEMIDDLKTVFGNNTRIAICRELTKIHEEIIIDTLNNIKHEMITNKGEFVIVIDNNNANQNLSCIDDYRDEILDLLHKDWKTKDISHYLANKSGLKQKDLYNLVIEIKNDKHK